MEEELAITLQTFSFGGQSIKVHCRRTPEEAADVTLTLQCTVDEVWESFWNFGSKPSKEPTAAAPPPPKPDKTELLGLDVWPAAITLCQYLAAHQHLVAGVSVAELGSGMGLPGLLCAKLGARHVLSSDYVDEVVGRLRENGALNDVGPPAFEAVRLDWTNLSSLQPQHLHAFRLVLLADVLYQSQLVGPLVGATLRLLHPEGVVVLGHLPRRAIVLQDGIPTLVNDDEPYHVFRAAAEAAGLHVRVLSNGRADTAAGAEGESSGGEGKQQPLLLAFALDPAQLPALPCVG